MRRIAVTTAVLFLAMSAAPACGGDSGDDNGAADTAVGDDTGPGDGDAGGGTTPGDDATGGDATGGDDDAAMGDDAGPGDDDAAMGGDDSSMGGDDSSMGGDDSSMGGDDSSMGGDVADGPDAEPLPEPAEGESSWMATIAIPGDDDPCCFDYDGDGAADNGLGSLLGVVAGVIPDEFPADGISAVLQAAIDAGEMDVVLDIEAGTLIAHAAVSDSSFDEKHQGMGAFESLPYEADTTTAATLVSVDASHVDGEFSGAGGTASLPLFGFIDEVVPVPLTDVRVAGKFTDEDPGFSIADGEMGGLANLGDLADSINSSLTDCPCLGLEDGDAVLELASEDTLACTAAYVDAESACTDEDGSACVRFSANKAVLCGALGLIHPDIDTDGSGTADSFSFALRFGTVPATLTGVAEAEPAQWGPTGCAATGSNEAGLGVIALLLLALGLVVVRRRERL